MRKRFKIAVAVGAAALLVAVGGGIWYYFGERTKSPEYAIDVVEESIANHDKEKFYKYVDVDRVLESSYDGFVEGLTLSGGAMTDEARASVKDFTQMLKTPLILSMKTAIDGYVETGKFGDADNAGMGELLSRTGFDGVQFLEIADVKTDETESTATATMKTFQPELDREFDMQIILTKKDDGHWQVTGIRNFQDFIAMINRVRREKIDDYLTTTAEINMRHDAKIREAEQKYGTILGFGSLGRDETRADLKKLMTDVIAADWEQRKQELSAVVVPKGAETLQNLRLKICDLNVGYATDYAKWLDDKRAATIKSAEEKRRQARTLETEATVLARKMTTN